MFSPSRDQVRDFFCQTWRKHRDGAPLAGLELIARDLIIQHPEYDAVLADSAAARDQVWTPESGQSNPFLHLSMHLAIEEQLSIDQPAGIRAAAHRLETILGDTHAARHAILECLGEMLWSAERDGCPPDATRYIGCIRAAARMGRD